MVFKNNLIVIASLGLAFFLACGDSSKEKGTGTGEKQIISQEIPAVCIWDGAGLRPKPFQNAKWQSNIALGEKVTYLGITKIDSASQNQEFKKVRLSDNSEGWVVDYCIVENANPAVITQNSSIYNRPDLLTITKFEFTPMEIIAVAEEKNEWLRVIGSKNEKKGWIQAKGTSTNDIDIAVAKLATKALTEKDESKRIEQIQNILDNPAFSGSVFIPGLQEKIAPVKSPAEEVLDSYGQE